VLIFVNLSDLFLLIFYHKEVKSQGDYMVKVLFVCIHNSARSQMAEAFLNKLGEGLFVAESAGLEAGTLNPYVVKVMQEIDYDLSKNETKSVFDFFQEGRRYQAVIKVCDQINGERCPIFPQTLINENWNLEDPSAIQGDDEAKLNRTREIRDQIHERVLAFIEEHKAFALKRQGA
jgi:arsenate reductase (thioredoxin)